MTDFPHRNSFYKSLLAVNSIQLFGSHVGKNLMRVVKSCLGVAKVTDFAEHASALVSLCQSLGLTAPDAGEYQGCITALFKANS